MRDAHAYCFDGRIDPDLQKEARAVLRRTVPVTCARKEPTAKALARGAEGTVFRCIHCGQETSYVDGGADLLPFGCSKCWCKAKDALAEAGIDL